MTIRCSNSCSALTERDYDELLAIARFDLESRTWLVGLTEKVGKLVARLPTSITKMISAALEPALRVGNRVAAYTHAPAGSRGVLARVAGWTSGEWFHRGAVTLSGFAGGFFGAPTAIVDVAASTTLVLRSIQEIAISYGEDLSDPSSLAECLSVLAMGGPLAEDDKLDEGYWTTRAALHMAITPAAVTEALASKTAQDFASAAAVRRLLDSTAFQKVLERFAITTQAAFAEKAVPVVGAVAGSVVNYQFMAYYQRMAHVLYRLKEVEARYDPAQVRSCYGAIARSLASA